MIFIRPCYQKPIGAINGCCGGCQCAWRLESVNHMAVLAPPPAPPRIDLGDNDGLGRYRLRWTQATTTVVTVVATGWLCTLGVIPAIIGLMTAKHVLVAVLVMGLGVDSHGRNQQ
jgi:hypothetical protein